MTTYVKPTVRKAWAEGASSPANLVDPGDTAVGTGWPASATPPSRQWFNWVLNWAANAVRYFMQRGIVDYDAAETYQIGAIVRGPDNIVYASRINANVNHTPSSSPTQWGPPYSATPDPGDNTNAVAVTGWVNAWFTRRANNLSDLTSAGTARANLGLSAIASSGSASDLGSGSIPVARVPVGAVTQWQANLSIAGTQVTGFVANATHATTATSATSATTATTATSAGTATTATKLTTAAGTAPSYSARAAVTFNAAGGILMSLNVASVTHVAGGHWNVNFTTAMPSANYASIGMAMMPAGNFSCMTFQDPAFGNPSVSSCPIAVDNQNGNAIDATRVSVAFFN